MEPPSEYEQPLPIRERDGGLSCQRDADMSVRDTTARVRGEWRHAVAMSNVDTEPLSEYEQPLPIRERDDGPVVPATRRHARHRHGGASARGVAMRRNEVMREHGAAIEVRTAATNP
ncbi:MAG: hypothetical protein IJK52_02235 [Oscillospiraceae bacterium]|nr:hypothetical protein [Oscillospiraceae bacterium]